VAEKLAPGTKSRKLRGFWTTILFGIKEFPKRQYGLRNALFDILIVKLAEPFGRAIVPKNRQEKEKSSVQYTHSSSGPTWLFKGGPRGCGVASLPIGQGKIFRLITIFGASTN
jgi:hypothetical protein